MGFVQRSVFYSAGGDSVAPDRFPSSDICLGGVVKTCSWVYIGCSSWFGGDDMRIHVLGSWS